MNTERRTRLLARLENPSEPLHIVGLGRFGGNLALIEYLASKGHSMVLWESAKAETLEASWKRLEPYHSAIQIYWDEAQPRLPKNDWVFVTPAISWQHEALKGISTDYLSTEIEVSLSLADQMGIDIHVVLGSVGKSTCTALMGEALQTPQVGNIGCSLLSLCDDPPTEVVLELSSFQLHYLQPTQWSPKSFLLTPVDDHHADWHGGLEAYQRAKLDWVDRWSLQEKVPHVQFREFDFAKALPRTPKLIGTHNVKNIQAVLEWLDQTGKRSETNLQRCLDFPGLEHRLELCFDTPSLQCYNDSKATSPSAAIEALNAFQEVDLFILQGHLKDLDYRELTQKAASKSKRIWLVGGMKELQAHFKGNDQVQTYSNLSEAFSFLNYPRTGKILFSPAAPSYGDYQNYEERGVHFKTLCHQAFSQ